MTVDSSSVPIDSQETLIVLERTSLSEQATDILRDRIINGLLRPGTRLVERRLAKMLGVSGAPVREALIRLEKEGLVVSSGRTRHVVELSKRDVVELAELRTYLEKLAVDLAVRNTNEENRAQLLSKLEELRQACVAGDAATARRRDMELHRLIWKQSGNHHLLNALTNIASPSFMLGPVFLGVEMYLDQWMSEHEELAHAVVSGDRATAIKNIEEHLRGPLQDIVGEVEGSSLT